MTGPVRCPSCGSTTTASPPPGGVIYQFEVPADGCLHEHEMTGPVLHVAAARDRVEVWALHHAGNIPTTRLFRVFATGQDIPAGHVHVGTAVAELLRVYVPGEEPSGPIVWHLMEQQ